MKIIDLFAGAGGLSEGFRRAGFDVASHVEMNIAAALTLKTREAYYYCLEHEFIDNYITYITGGIEREQFYNLIPNEILAKVINEEISTDTFASITERINELLDGDDVLGIIGGPPCQAYSLAGRSRDRDRMENDPRNYLYQYYLQFIEYYHPTFFVFENVQGLLSAQNGQIFGTIQERMRELGYTIDHRLLNSNDFGVIQSRKRIIIIGWRSDQNLEYPNFDNEELEYSIRDLFADLPSIHAGETNNIYNTTANECLRSLKIRSNYWNTLTYHTSRPNNNNDLEIYRHCCSVWNTEQTHLKYCDLPTHLMTHRNSKAFLDRFKVIDYNGISHTIVAHIAKDGHHFIHPDINQNRSLTVREAARIQSFSDDYFFENSRTSAFQQIGNAVPPLMAEKIALAIRQLLEDNN